MLKRIASALLLCTMLLTVSCTDNSDGDSALRSVTVATSENIEIDGAVMTYFYNDNLLAFVNNYSAVLATVGLDPTKPLKDQPRKNGEGTWYDYFVSQTCTVTHYLMTLNEIAMAEGVSLTDSEKVAINAAAEMVTEGWYGKGVGSADISKARQLEALAYKFENLKKAELMPDEAEMAAYFAENEADFEYDESATVNVRHILLRDAYMPNHNAAVAAANELLERFESGEKTAEAFNLLVLEYSNDPGSVYSGGLYRNLRRETTVEEFDKWCFDEARKPGDTAVIETEYGAHVMYFEGEGLPVWQAEVSDKMVSERLKEFRVERFADFPVSFDEEALKIVG